MVKIRLRRVGAKKQASFRVVVADSRAPRDGRFIEQIGFYNPRTEPETLRIDEARALHWLKVGAQPTDSAARLLKTTGTMERFERLKQGESLEDLVAEAEQARAAEVEEEEIEEEAREAEIEEEAPEAEIEEEAPEAEIEEGPEVEAPEAEAEEPAEAEVEEAPEAVEEMEEAEAAEAAVEETETEEPEPEVSEAAEGEGEEEED
jgi:small subunit ribosomal protein S16